MTKETFSITIYLLITILVLVLSIFTYRITIHISYSDPHKQVSLSKYTGERIHSSYSTHMPKVATYINANHSSSIKGLSSADMVFEFLSSSSGVTYKAIYSHKAAENVSSSINLKDYSDSYLPSLNFVDSAEITNPSTKAATSIFITFNEDTSSNFLYENGEYHHYKGLCIDKDDNTTVKLSNVIVQFIQDDIISDESLTSSKNYGTGLLFCAGKVQHIKWTREKDSEIKITDQKGGNVLLMTGRTWWVLINKDCSVAYD